MTTSTMSRRAAAAALVVALVLGLAGAAVAVTNTGDPSAPTLTAAGDRVTSSLTNIGDHHAVDQPAPQPGTRVAATAFAGGQVVDTNRDVLPGERRARAPDYDQTAVGSSVAAEGDTASAFEGVGRPTAPSPDVAYPYTGSPDVAESIAQSGLRPGAFATPNGELSPLQTQIDLALPPNRGLPTGLVQIDIAGPREAGFEIPDVTQVGRSYRLPGGGWEMRFPYEVPSEFLKVVRNEFVP